MFMARKFLLLRFSFRRKMQKCNIIKSFSAGPDWLELCASDKEPGGEVAGCVLWQEDLLVCWPSYVSLLPCPPSPPIFLCKFVRQDGRKLPGSQARCYVIQISGLRSNPVLCRLSGEQSVSVYVLPVSQSRNLKSLFKLPKYKLLTSSTLALLTTHHLPNLTFLQCLQASWG